jgi:hypothetical protein
MSKQASRSHPPLGEYVKVRDLPDKLRLLLLVHHAIFKSRDNFLDDPNDEFFGSSVLKQPLIEPIPTLDNLDACWRALEKHPFRTDGGKIHGFLVHSRLNRLIGWAVTPEGTVKQNIRSGSPLMVERLISLFTRTSDGLTRVPAGVLYRIARGWRMIPDGIRSSKEEVPAISLRQLAEQVRPEDFNLNAYKKSTDEDVALFRAFCGTVPESAGGTPSSYGAEFKTFYVSCLSHYSIKKDREDWPPKRKHISPFRVHVSSPEQSLRPLENNHSERRFPVRKSSITSEQNTPFRAGFEAELNEDGILRVKGTVEDPAERLIFHGVSISAKLEGGPEDGFHRPSGDVVSAPGVAFAYGLPVRAKLDASGDRTVETILREGFQLGQVSAPNDPFTLGFEVQAPLVKIGLAGSGPNSNRTPTEIVREYLSSILAQFEPDWERRSIVPIYSKGRFDFTDAKNEKT